MLDKGESADIDRLRLDGVLDYRTLVLRRGPAASRPPSVLPPRAERAVLRGLAATRVRRADDSRAPLARERHSGRGSAPLFGRAAARAQGRGRFGLPGDRDTPRGDPRPHPVSDRDRQARINAPEAGRYTAWLAGDWFGNSSVEVDGHEVGAKRAELNWPGLYTDLGSVELGAGSHTVALAYNTGGWHPGSGGPPFSFGPLTLSRLDAREPVETVAPADARRCAAAGCDWIEAVG